MKEGIMLVVCWLATASLWAANEDYRDKSPTGETAAEPEPQPSSLALQRTAAAPLNAGGSAAFGPSTLMLHLQGLVPGFYWVNVYIKPGGQALTLGVISIFDPTEEPDEYAHETFKEPSSAHPAIFLDTQSQVQLPPGLNPIDIAWVTVSDSGGNVVLTTGGNPPVLH